MSITTTEFRDHLGKYITMSQTEDVYITRNGKVVAKLTNPYKTKMDIVDSLVGILPADITSEEAREERLKKYYDESDY